MFLKNKDKNKREKKIELTMNKQKSIKATKATKNKKLIKIEMKICLFY